MQQYNFLVNEWRSKDRSCWPLADQWLSGWNRLGQFAATSILTEPSEDPPAVRSANLIPDGSLSTPFSCSPIWCNVVKNRKSRTRRNPKRETETG
jgi:hypothetical protein